MANVITNQVLQNGNQWFVAKFSNASDGTAETSVVKVDPTSGFAGTTNVSLGVVIQGQTLYPGPHLKLMEIKYNLVGVTLDIQWDATSATDMWLLQGYGHHNFRWQGGISTVGIAGATGKVLFTTKGAAPGSSYTVDMWFKKDIVQ